MSSTDHSPNEIESVGRRWKGWKGWMLFCSSSKRARFFFHSFLDVRGHRRCRLPPLEEHALPPGLPAAGAGAVGEGGGAIARILGEANAGHAEDGLDCNSEREVRVFFFFKRAI